MCSKGDIRGFTLIELLVVLLILAMAAFVAVLAAPPLKSDAQKAAEQFSAVLALASDAAALSGAPARLVVTETGYAFERYDSPEWRTMQLGEAAGENRAPPGVYFEVNADAPYADNEQATRRRTFEDDGEERRIVPIDPAGFPTTIRADFVGDGRDRWRVLLTAEGAQSVERF